MTSEPLAADVLSRVRPRALPLLALPLITLSALSLSMTKPGEIARHGRRGRAERGLQKAPLLKHLHAPHYRKLPSSFAMSAMTASAVAPLRVRAALPKAVDSLRLALAGAAAVLVLSTSQPAMANCGSMPTCARPTRAQRGGAAINPRARATGRSEGASRRRVLRSGASRLLPGR